MDASVKTGYSIKWYSILAVSERFVALVTGIFLARILEPEDFGLVAMVNVFVGITAVFINSGTGSSIVQKEDLTQVDLSTIFFFNLTIGLLASMVLYFSAEAISRFYDSDKLANIVKILAWSPLINSLVIVQKFLMIRKIDLKKRTIAQLAGQVFAGILGLTMAILGHGVYALVWATISSSILSAALYWLQSSWIPTLVFNFNRFKNIWNYSGKILYTNVLLQIVNRVDELLVGKFVSELSLGLYNRGKSLSRIPTTLLGQVLTRSYFPILSRLQSDKRKLMKYYKIQSDRVVWVTIPLYSLLIVIAEELVVVLLGSKWISAVPFFRLALVADFIYSNNVFKVNLLNAIGKPEINFKRALIAGPIRLIFYLVPLLFSGVINPNYLLGVMSSAYLISFVWLTFDIREFLQLRIKQQLFPYLQYLTLAVICAIPTILISKGIANPLFSLILSCFAFTALYFALLLIARDSLLNSAMTKVGRLVQ